MLLPPTSVSHACLIATAELIEPGASDQIAKRFRMSQMSVNRWRRALRLYSPRQDRSRPCTPVASAIEDLSACSVGQKRALSSRRTTRTAARSSACAVNRAAGRRSRARTRGRGARQNGRWSARCGAEHPTDAATAPNGGSGPAALWDPGRPGASTCERAPGHYGFSDG